MAGKHVALLRGINVGGKNKLPMKDLVAIFEKLGCAEVKTYIQSGNVVFAAPAALAKGLPAKLASAIKKALGLQVPVVLRSAAEFRKAAAKHPLAGPGLDEKTLGIMFLADKPSAAQAKKLDPERSPGDRFKLVGRDLYMSYPNGSARSKLTNAYFDSVLETVSTARNWRTVGKLVEMLG